MNQTDVVNLMKSSQSEAEWNANCKKVKQAFGGDFPNFWYSAIIAPGVPAATARSYGGSADMRITAFGSRPIKDLYGRPTYMPGLKQGEKVVGVYDQGLGDKRKTCNTLEEMQDLYDSYAQGWALKLRWEIETVSETVLKA